MSTDLTEAETLAGDGNPLYTLIGFYRAFNARDFEGLVANWAEGDLSNVDNPISGIRGGWAAIREGYSKLFNGPASVRVAFHDFTSQGGSHWHLFIGCDRGICKTPAVSLDLRIRTSIAAHSLTRDVAIHRIRGFNMNTMKQSADPNVQYPKARRYMRRLLRLASAAVAVLAIITVSAESAGDLKPPIGYRDWFHVNTMIVDKNSPLFEALGGMHNVHVNAVGEPALKKGGPYPNGTVFVTDLHDFSVVDGSYVEGARKGLALMVKDSKVYASTGGWGFQFWLGGDPKKPIVTDATKQCFECHQPKKNQDYVYSTYIP
jgi:hypothetical protein